MQLSRVSIHFAALLLFSSASFLPLSLAATPDRITGTIDTSDTAPLRGTVHPAARAEFDQGRVDPGKVLPGLSLVFKPSAKQQRELDKLLAQQQDPASPNFHQWLTPAQFAERFGLSPNDVKKVAAWLQSQGFQVTQVANSRNEIFFQGTVGQAESAFRTEIHNFLVDGEMHYANATEPSVPAALSASVIEVRNLHNFHPRPRAQVRHAGSDATRPNFTSHISGSHFLAPGDFATIYDVNSLYSANADGSGQSIAIVGQSSINLTDISNFRSAAGLSAKAPTILLEPGTGTSSKCSGDEGESDLDLEWSGAVAKNATITFVYVGLASGDTCSNRRFGAFEALRYAVDQDVAPIISNSYGNCEANVTLPEAQTIQGWAKQANSQGQTIISASGDSGAADCDFHVTSAALGFAVDIPAAIPEVTGAGGTEFNPALDPSATVSGSDAGATTYWSGTTGGTDAISSALSYIPEIGWNDSTFDIAHQGDISASGGGKSTFFTKPSWQTGTGVPSDGQRDVPDVAVNASADHDGYLFCSEDGAKVPTCSSGFRDSNTNVAIVGGTSAAAPTLAGIVALINQYVGNTPPSGLGNINPNLYKFATSTPAVFNDVTTGDNIVPCTKGTTDCPASAPFQYGFTTGTGYDQVTGLGSVNAFALAQAWAASVTNFTLTATPSSVSTTAGQTSSQIAITVNPLNGFTGSVTFTCSGQPTGATCNFNPTSSSTSTVLTIQTAANMAAESGAAVTVKGTSGAVSGSTDVALTVAATTESFTIATNAATFSVSAGAAASIPITVSSSNGFVQTTGGNSTTVLPVTYTCTGLPSEATCNFSPSSSSSSASVTLSIATTAPTAQLRQRPGSHGLFYAALLPGLFGIFFVAGSKGRSSGCARMLILVGALGFSSLWLTSCGGTTSHSNANPGTPAGTSTITVNATTGGANPITSSLQFNLVVSQ
ncbi:MAG TPA: S53 family peptidase [Candidatus Sulfotelmatobacter sp.]